jgi:hypothetical protein
MVLRISETLLRGDLKKAKIRCRDFLRHKEFVLDPNLLREKGIQVNHLEQEAGEIIITFPRGLHFGFNAGYNMAIAVNYGNRPWLQFFLSRTKCPHSSASLSQDLELALVKKAEDLAVDDVVEEVHMLPPRGPRQGKFFCVHLCYSPSVVM